MRGSGPATVRRALEVRHGDQARSAKGPWSVPAVSGNGSASTWARGAPAHSARGQLVLGDCVFEVVGERVSASRARVGRDRVVEALLELGARGLAVGDRQQ